MWWMVQNRLEVKLTPAWKTLTKNFLDQMNMLLFLSSTLNCNLFHCLSHSHWETFAVIMTLQWVETVREAFKKKIQRKEWKWYYFPLYPPLPPYKVKKYKVNYRTKCWHPLSLQKSEKLCVNIMMFLNLFYYKETQMDMKVSHK